MHLVEAAAVRRVQHAGEARKHRREETFLRVAQRADDMRPVIQQAGCNVKGGRIESPDRPDAKEGERYERSPSRRPQHRRSTRATFQLMRSTPRPSIPNLYQSLSVMFQILKRLQNFVSPGKTIA